MASGLEQSLFHKYVIIGAGPTGLGAAQRLVELKEEDFIVLEKECYPGGLSASFVDDKGFTWDIGGHVIFSHYDYFDRLVDELLEGTYFRYQRKAYIRILERWVPYPFQNSLRLLPPKQRWECLEGLFDVPHHVNPFDSFYDWILKTFGAGLAKWFFLPYNKKVWATPLERMDWRWISERVSVIDLRRAVRNIALEQDDSEWGPNNTFLFPVNGGTGTIFRRLAQRHAQHIFFNTAVEKIDLEQKVIFTGDGKKFKYSILLSTVPLDKLVLEFVLDAPDIVRKAAATLEHNSVHIVGFGVNEIPDNSMCWMYFPEPVFPFYRVTNFHHYSPYHTPAQGKQKALMTEISFSDYPESVNKRTADWR